MWLEGGKARGKSEASVGSGSFRGSKGGAGGFEKPACPKFLIGRVKETAIRNIRCGFSRFLQISTLDFFKGRRNRSVILE